MNVYRARRRGALRLGVLTLALAYLALGAAGRLLAGNAQALSAEGHARAFPQHQAPGLGLSWPPQGQAAFAVGAGRAATSPHQQEAPIASLAKVMTAYLTLKRYPLSGEQAGFTIAVTAAEAQAEAVDVSEGQSGVAVRPGEQLTERQLLEALLIPSGNNIADLLAEHVAGSQAGFVAQMNAEAHLLGMRHTLYTDPSGFAQSTVSTAADQLRVLRAAMTFTAFRQIVSMSSVTLPFAGTLMNFNPLTTAGYAGKTGSDSAAGGCLAFFTRVTLGGRRQTAVGVVMGQGAGSDTSEILAAAGQAAQQLVMSATGSAPN